MAAQLPVDPTTTVRVQNVEVLMIGESQGWFRYDGMDVRKHPSGPDQHHVRMPDGARVTLLTPEVRPWVLGVAHAHGSAHLVAYREGLIDEPA